MDLLKRNIHMDRTRCEAVNQITLEDDRNIPDSKPDVSGINLEKASVIVDEIKPGNDVVTVTGRLHFCILYHTQETGCGLVLLEGDIPFEEKLMMKGVTPSDQVKANGEVEDFSVSVINSRKLGLRSLITLSAFVEELYDEEVPIGVHMEEDRSVACEYRKCPTQVAQIVIFKNDVFRVREEMTLPSNLPNINQILWSDIEASDVEFKLLDESLQIRGDVRIFILYEGEGEEHSVRFYETVLPFEGNLECHGCREGMLPNIQFQMGQPEIGVKPDLDGEERCIALEMSLDISIRIYDEEQVDIVTDMYGVAKKIETTTQPGKLCRVKSCVTGKTKISDHVRIPGGGAPILQILHSQGEICQEQTEVVEEGILVKGGICIRVLYITGDDEHPYASVTAQLPYRYVLEVPDMQPQDIGKVKACMEQLQVTMLDGEEMDVKAVLLFSTVVFEQKEQELIRQIQVTELDADTYRELPGMVIYLVREEDNLWSIGRKYYIPVQRIKILNQLTSDEIRPGQKLLLVK